MTKKARTILTAFAGSIGIIGIALILSVSNGVQNYIDDVQEDTLSGYPISIMRESMNLDELLETLSGETEPGEHDDDRVYSSAQMSKFFNTLKNTEKSYNDLKKFKVFLETDDEIREQISAIQYAYQNNLLIYRTDDGGNLIKVNPSPILESMQNAMGVSVSTGNNSVYSQMSANSMQVWAEMILDKDGGIINDLVKEQYDIVGSWPTKAEEVVLVTDKNNEISDVFLYSLGLLDQSKLEDAIKGEVSEEDASKSWSYDELLGLEFYAVLPSSLYSDTDSDGIWTNMEDNEEYMKIICDTAIKVKVTGVIKPNEDAVTTSLRGAVGYTHELTELVINKTNDSEIVKAQKDDPATDIFTGLPFKTDDVKEPTADEKSALFTEYASSLTTEKKAELYVTMMSTIPDDMLEGYLTEAMKQYPDRASMEAVITESYSATSGTDPETIKEYIAGMSDEDLTKAITEFASAKISADYAEKVAGQLKMLSTDQLSMGLDALILEAGNDTVILSGYYDKFVPSGYSESTYELNIKALSAMDLDDPAMINIYASSFEAKDNIADLIDKYNKKVGEDSDIQYTDYVAIIMSSITTIINAISYVLIAFVSISLVVSSIMIGIITYISVLERTKEIGILRAIGASKKDISRVFNAETLIVGLTAGVFGIGITLLLCIPINYIIQTLSGIPNLAASLPPTAGVILVIISILLTVVAGLIPSRIAAKKDPVESLRSE